MARRRPLYSVSSRHGLTDIDKNRRHTAPLGGIPREPQGPGSENASTEPRIRRIPLTSRLRSLYARYERLVLVSAGAGLAIISVLLFAALRPVPREYTQEDIDAAVLYTLDNLPEEPALARTAYEVVRPSVVRVSRHDAGSEVEESGVGTGVVIIDTGVVLTSLHVVAGAESVSVTFADGFKTSAQIVSAEPERDLAVLQVEVIPEGLQPATLASSEGLEPGDDVVAVGNPFGIGSSVSSGVVSGLGRSYVSRTTGTPLTGLIQFDAAVNPGNSGGPLINRRGEVVGIVISLLNPTEDGVFIGIGFAVPIEAAAAAAGPSPF